MNPAEQFDAEDFAPVAGVNEVLWSVQGDLGRLRLNRPAAINALSRPMIDAIGLKLREWAAADEIAAVRLSGAGERGLCSGADVRGLRELVLAGDSDPADFFRAEYQVNALIAAYPKPYEARMHGIVMGGGLGLSVHASRRLVAPDSRLAMPETIIGFFPDVGVLWHLGRAPGEWGTHLALSGNSVDGTTALGLGLADGFLDGRSAPKGVLEVPGWITECYQGDDAAEVLGRLEQHADPDARAAAADIRARSPLSVAVALEALRRAQRMTGVADVLAQDWVLAQSLIRQPDFVEGVRAQLVDKDRSPRWSHARLEDVTRAEVLALFRPEVGSGAMLAP